MQLYLYVLFFTLNVVRSGGKRKARSTLATMSKQHCRSNCLLLRQCCRFGQHCRRRNFNAKLVRHCCHFWQQCRTLLRHCCWCGPGLSVS